ncbi:HS12B-like protein [Mya arenaria]|uniref:HS12B-like protein n=1 Tax=Mya arenaria TaxID=6604 RepID=A0ABY7G139_MYAAR|nr:HS12B-like protein [Mya arenaria]
MKRPFLDNVQKESYKVILEDGKVCCNCFDIHITAGQCLFVGEAQVEKSYTPATSNKNAIIFPDGRGLDRSVEAPLLVAAIDFGTTYSGWSYSFKHDFELDPIKVTTRRWHGGQLMSMKAPTCVLIEPDGETFSAFGYDAENNYTRLAEAEEHEQWYFFKRFKMKLYNEDINRDMKIEDKTGKKLKADIVFSAAIRPVFLLTN